MASSYNPETTEYGDCRTPAIARRQRRDKQRALYRFSELPRERLAFDLAEKGYGIDDLIVRTCISRAEARLLILGD